MGLLIAAGNTSAKTNYPLATFPARDMQALYPLSVWWWSRHPDTSSTFEAFSFNDATNRGFDSYYDSAGFHVEEFDGTTDVEAASTGTPSTTAWNGWGGVYVSAGLRRVYGPTGAVVSSTTNSPSASNSLVNLRLACIGTTTHAMAEFAAWNAELGPSEYAALRAGANPLTIRPGKMLCYFPMRGDMRDHGPMGLQVKGVGTWDKATAAYTSHPAVQPPPRRKLWKHSTAAARRPILIYA